MRPEVLFLKYAFPCSFIIKERGEISREEYCVLEDAAVKGKALPRELLEKVYFRAFERIEKVASESGKDKWDEEVIKEYFLIRHNQIIDQGMYAYAEAPEALRELCKIKEGRVLGIKGGALVVEYEKGKRMARRAVSGSLVPGIRKGDRITIHYGYAVERLQHVQGIL